MHELLYRCEEHAVNLTDAKLDVCEGMLTMGDIEFAVDGWHGLIDCEKTVIWSC